MTVLVWITEDSWQACVDAVHSLAPASQDVTLLHVTDTAAWSAPSFPDSGFVVYSRCGLSFQVLIADLLRSPVLKSGVPAL